MASSIPALCTSIDRPHTSEVIVQDSWYAFCASYDDGSVTIEKHTQNCWYVQDLVFDKQDSVGDKLTSNSAQWSMIYIDHCWQWTSNMHINWFC